MGDLVDSMLDLMRRLPPTRTEENVDALVRICPDYADDLLGSVDQPLQLKTDVATGRDYLACDYNRDGESYRYVSAHLQSRHMELMMELGHHGRMNMTLHWMMVPFHPQSCGSLRFRRMRLLIPTERCISKGECLLYTCGISTTVVSLVLSCSRKV